jgi:hypothetical protein
MHTPYYKIGPSGYIKHDKHVRINKLLKKIYGDQLYLYCGNRVIGCIIIVLEKPFLFRSCSHQPAFETLAYKYNMLTKQQTVTYPRQKCHFRAVSSLLH